MHPAEHIELSGWREVWEAAPPELAARHGIAVAEIGGALCTAVGELESTMFNRVVGLGLAEPAADGDLDAIDGVLRRARAALLRLAEPAGAAVAT